MLMTLIEFVVSIILLFLAIAAAIYALVWICSKIGSLGIYLSKNKIGRIVLIIVALIIIIKLI